jgi:site-specific recombinase XerD
MTYFKVLREFFQWISVYKSTGRNPKAEELRDIDITLLPLSAAVDVTKNDIETYLFYLKSYLDNEAATRNKKLVAIRSFYDYLLDHQEALEAVLPANPAGRIKRPKAPKKEPVYLPEADQEAFLGGIDGENDVRDYAIFLLLLATGLRLSEVVGINLRDVDLDGSTIRIRHGKGNKERTAYLTPPCCEAIRRYLEEYRAAIPELDTDALFVSKRFKTRLTGRSIEKAMQKYAIKAKLGGKHYTPHKLRHTTASTLAKEGADSLIIKEILGHEDISTTQIYMHLDKTDVANAVNTSGLRKLGARVFAATDDEQQED